MPTYSVTVYTSFGIKDFTIKAHNKYEAFDKAHEMGDPLTIPRPLTKRVKA